MSIATFDARDRADFIQIPDRFDGKRWTTKDRDPDHARIRLMARSGGYVMVRKPHCSPFVLSEKDWAKLPLFEATP